MRSLWTYGKAVGPVFTGGDVDIMNFVTQGVDHVTKVLAIVFSPHCAQNSVRTGLNRHVQKGVNRLVVQNFSDTV